MALHLTGQRFGRFVVLSLAAKLPRTGSVWNVRCDCGQTAVVRGSSLTSGHARSCGCLKRDQSRDAARHGHAGDRGRHPVYSVWSAMVQRCTNPKNQQWPNYGGRGISVCERWRRDYAAFAADMGPRPDGHSLERIDNDGNYEPGNCRWATALDQSRNQRKVRILDVDGNKLGLLAASKYLAIPYGTLRRMLLPDGPGDALKVYDAADKDARGVR